MITDELKGLIARELLALRNGLLAYEDAGQIWDRPPGVNNSSGNLALHLTGNLRHYIGAQLGGTGYVRDREREFTARGIPLAELLEGIDSAIAEVGRTLDGLAEADLDQPYPLEVGGVSIRTGEFLLHLAVHLGYHLGQLDYHRRTVSGSDRSVRALNVRDLTTASSG
jgi:uncharacterized damage-inducible protein DinB